MPKLTDKQFQAVMHDDGNILVSASAGSGKTHTMIERVKRLVLEKNANVGQILCVTFTEKAASEMKEKLKSALCDNLDGQNKQRIYSQLVELPTADICTLHSFCGKLIRLNFFSAGVAPDFRIMDESESNVMRLECVDKAFKEFYDSGGSWFYTLVDRYAIGRTDARLKQLVLSACAFCDSEADPDSFMDKYRYYYSPDGLEFLLGEYKRALDRELSALLDSLIEPLNVFNTYDMPKALSFTNTLYLDVKSLIDSTDVYFVKKFEKYDLRLDFERKIDPAVVDYKAVVKDARDKFKKLCAKFCAHLTDKETDQAKFFECAVHTEQFLRLVKRYKEIYSAEKREENALDFNDLEHFAIKILSDEQLREAIKQKYKYVFVDEYQDINGAQEQIINYISADNLFMVGDNKQSIYGFRGCRPEFFTNKSKDMAMRGQKTLMLNHNFRSSGAVIKLVNSIFNFCMTEEFFGESYEKNSQLIAGAPWAEKEVGRAKLHFLKKPEKESSVEETPRIYDILQEINGREEQSPIISSLLTSIIDDELTKTYFDPKDQVHKKISYGDIVILTRNKNNGYVANLVKGLTRHGIPVSSDVKENVCDFPEISVMINALKLVDCFKQDLPLAVVLKSPIGRFTDEDFIEMVGFYEDAHENKKDWSFFDAYVYYLQNANTPLSLRLKDFNAYFEKIRFISDFVGAQGVLDRLIKDNDIESYLYAQRLGAMKVGRLRRFIGASVLGEKRLTVKEFLLKIENAPDSFGFSESGEEDAVKVMTIHASKGLEFPVVIVCGLERQYNDEEEREEILFSRNYGLAVKSFNDQNRTKNETLLRGVIRQDMKLERMKEEMRLFYVATTRAQYSLHLTVEAKEDTRKDRFCGADHFIDYLPKSIEAEYHDQNEFNFIDLRQGVRKVIIGKSDQKVVDKISQNLSFNYPFDADTILPLKSNVTSAVKNTVDESQLVHVLFDEPSPDIEKGNIAHKILEFLDFEFKLSFDEQIENMISSGVLCLDDVKKVNIERIRRAIENSALSSLNGFKLYREKPFIASIDASAVLDTTSTETIVVQGVIDLLAVKDGIAYIIDYKYSSLEKQSLVDKYAKQLDLYALAVQKVLSLKVDKKVLVNLFTGEHVEF
ncbi:MAG: UvrD-helicase domain-containing protein [Clostridia bacterium]|nr:UvrD-helicase domain-containing protein [Clostridia bacterium]